MAIGLKTSTPALRTSSEENAPMSMYISSRSFDFGGLARPGARCTDKPATTPSIHPPAVVPTFTGCAEYSSLNIGGRPPCGSR